MDSEKDINHFHPFQYFKYYKYSAEPEDFCENIIRKGEIVHTQFNKHTSFAEILQICTLMINMSTATGLLHMKKN